MPNHSTRIHILRRRPRSWSVRSTNGASKVLRIAPASAPAALQEAVLADLTDVGESTALFTDVRRMTMHCLLQHALTHVISEGIINSLIVSNSAEGNLALTRVHERLLTRMFHPHL